MTQEELNRILEKHGKWLRSESSGERASLRNVDLRWANLRGVTLRDVDLQGADLRGADLQCADLRGADLQGVNLREANLRYADLRWANLRAAKLREADLRWANLRWAKLQYACLRRAGLREADFREADLQHAELQGADLRRADLRGANLRDAKKNETALTLQCPEEGSFIAWKKLKDEVIAKLLIPEDAFRSSSTSRKCRASRAIVLEIYSANGEPITEGISRHGKKLTYRVGEVVYPDKWDEDRWNECSNGIHFFITREEAEGYY